MKKYLASTIFIIISICLAPVTGLSCTTFVLDNNGQPVYGKNMDWTDYGPCSVFVNKRGFAKTCMPVPAEQDTKTISWTSKFGSVTFNWYYGREFPFEGINEAGLFVSTMGLPATEFPGTDSRPALYAFQWVQYQLDNFSSVDEVIASDRNVRPAMQGSRGCHFLVSDSKGNCASIEWLDGKMVYHTGETLPYKALTNSTYEESIEYLKRFWGFGGFFPIPRPLFYRPTLPRFALAAKRVKNYSPQYSGDAVKYAFRILQDVEVTTVKKSAVWSAVYDYSNDRIYLRSWNHARIRSFNLSAFDFSCRTPVKVLDITADLSGDVTDSFVDYTKEIDLAMLEGWVPKMTDAEIDNYAAYPDTTVCTEQ
jgi:penicillin V acylase-like amidase (Ntn superfamily)